MPGMNTTTKKTLVLAASLLTGVLLMGQNPAVEPAQETVSVENPVKAQVDAPVKVPVQVDPQAKVPAQAPAHKIEWKSEEAKRRLSGQAAEPSHPEDAKSKASKDGPPAWRLAVAFAVMALLLYGLYLFLKKFGKKITGQETTGLKLISKLRLDSRNNLVLVQFHEEELLISVNSSGGVQLLSKCAQIELAEAEANAGKVEENDLPMDGEAEIYNSFGSQKLSGDVIKTVKDGLI